ncbi:hypothetical protein Plec18167_009278 [Paecilomyces lecythidis]|uniref:PIN domain-containing protein n=1 Tax=Paecilomyces lecythidis TaxID=3004212 RepID=A0ABR3WQ99_9EURO
MAAARKVFHCAVDDTALTTNISEIKKWTSNGAITLVVPLYTLERLHALKRAGSQVAINAREAVRFLDRVTSGKDSISADKVALQGPMEQYETWAEAEKFLLPEFEEDVEATTEEVENVTETQEEPERQVKTKAVGDHVANNDLSQMLLSKLNFKKEPDTVSITSTGTHSDSRSSSRSSRTNPEYGNGHNEVEDSTNTNGHRRSNSQTTGSTVPLALRPLLSALLWRLHDSPDAASAARSLILVTNDRLTQGWAQKFGIATKNIHQLRTAIQYEEKEYKNRCKYVEKTQATEPKTLLSYENESDEDELVFVPRGRGKGASRGGSSRASNNNRKPSASKTVPPLLDSTIEIPSEPIDPNSFSRSLGSAPKQPAVDLSSQAGAARGLAGASRRFANGRRGAPRGQTRGNSSRGRGKLWVP